MPYFFAANTGKSKLFKSPLNNDLCNDHSAREMSNQSFFAAAKLSIEGANAIPADANARFLRKSLLEFMCLDLMCYLYISPTSSQYINKVHCLNR